MIFFRKSAAYCLYSLLLLTNVTWGAGENLSMLRSVVPADAVNFKKAEFGNTHQVSFSVARDYPGIAFDQAALEVLVRSGWKRCGEASNAWESFIDATVKPEVVIYQSVLHFFDGHQMLVLSSRIVEQKKVGQIQPSAKPATNNQNGIALIIGEMPGAEPLPTMLGVNCSAR